MFHSSDMLSNGPESVISILKSSPLKGTAWYSQFPVVEKIVSEHTPVAQAKRVKTFDAMGGEFALLLSLMLAASGRARMSL